MLPDDHSDPVNGSTISLPNFEISWVGESPWADVFCFGSDEGKVQFVGSDRRRVQGPYTVAESGEAINGVAFTHDIMAVSTRSDVTFWNIPEADQKKRMLAHYDGGAHGVTANGRGGFLAPIGPSGLLSFDRGTGRIRTTRSVTEKTPYNYYKVTNLGLRDQKGVLACALRRGGLATLICDHTSTFVSVRTSQNSDIIDACPLDSQKSPFAVAAVNIDCTLFFMKDITDDLKPRIFRFQEMSGIAYRILSANGHIILLTNDALHVWPGLATRFLEDKEFDSPATIRTVPIQAVDASVVFDRWIHIVDSDGSVFMIPTAQFSNANGIVTSRLLSYPIFTDMKSLPQFELAFSAA